ncbi:hypothetical protein CRE_02606 [Caenorhabditis remanei]|uniref:K Homology domain-containing protein n=1 Tax=Caenorhabditis remanei TaxID=31234 RepID=E3N9U0_CAERE|nr:hypothetical protein CRE_02606 [Caenorhabditis remanei]
MVYYVYLYPTMANVRFDTKQEEEIEYHTDRRFHKEDVRCAGRQGKEGTKKQTPPHAQAQNSNKDPANKNATKGDGEILAIKVLIPSSAVAAIIGECGVVMNTLRKDHKCQIQISKNETYPGTLEQICIMKGSLRNILAVIESIQEKIRMKCADQNLFQKFLNNGNVSLCGAQVLIAVKRYPDESDVSDIISQLRDNHVMVRIAVDSIPSGGSNSASLYEMAYQTNGYCAFATGSDLSITFDWMTSMLQNPYQFVAQNFLVSGTGRIELAVFKTPKPPGSTDWCLFAVTVQNHTLDNSFISMNYTIESTDRSSVFKFPSDNSAPLYGTEQTDDFIFYSSLSYKWTIDYQYNNDEPQIIECRMYSESYHDFVPLPDF